MDTAGRAHEASQAAGARGGGGSHERTRPTCPTSKEKTGRGGSGGGTRSNRPPSPSLRCRAHLIGAAAAATSPRQAVFPVTVALSSCPLHVAEFGGGGERHHRNTPNAGAGIRGGCVCPHGACWSVLVVTRGGARNPGRSRLPRVWGPGPGVGCGASGDFLRCFIRKHPLVCFQPSAAAGGAAWGGARPPNHQLRDGEEIDAGQRRVLHSTEDGATGLRWRCTAGGTGPRRERVRPCKGWQWSRRRGGGRPPPPA